MEDSVTAVDTKPPIEPFYNCCCYNYSKLQQTTTTTAPTTTTKYWGMMSIG